MYIQVHMFQDTEFSRIRGARDRTLPSARMRSRSLSTVWTAGQHLRKVCPALEAVEYFKRALPDVQVLH